MTKAYRSADEQELLSVRNLERRIANLERAASGIVHLQAPVTTDVTITATTSGTAQDLTGASISIVRPGLYIVLGFFDMEWTVASAGTIAIGQLAVTGGTITYARVPLLECLGTATRATISDYWTATFTGAGTLRLQAYKSAAAGTLTCKGQSSGAGSGVLVAIRTGPA